MADKIKFEDSLKKLEKIVEKLEKGDLPLEDSLKLYEEGVILARACQKKITEMEAKIEILSKNKEGNLADKPFELEKNDSEH